MAKDGIRVHIYGDYNDKDVNKAIRDLQSLKKNSQDTQTKFAGLSKGMKIAGAAIAAAAAAAAYGVVRFAGESINAASDLEESLSKVRTVFGDASGSVESFAKDAAVNLGLSEQAALEATGTFGNLFTAMGINAGKAAGLSTEVVQLAADLASFNNIDVQEAITALRSGLVGETEPLRRLGVNLNAARIQTEAFRLGLAKTKDDLDAAAKAQAAWSLITQDAATASGDFARTSDGLANTQRILKAAVDNAQASIGAGLVVAIQDATQQAGGPEGLASAIEDVGEEIGYMVRGASRVVQYLDDLADGFNEVAKRAGFADDETDGLAQQLSRLLTRGPQEGIQVIGDYLADLGREAEAAANKTAAMANVMAGTVKPADHLTGSVAELRGEVAALAAESDRATRSLTQVAIATGQVPSAARFAQRFDVAEMLDNIGKAAKSTGGASRSAASSVDKLSDRIESARDRAKSAIKDMRDKLRQELLDSRQEFNDYAASVSQSIRGAINFSDAAPEIDEQGNRVGTSFMEALQAQAARAQEFATKVKTLIAMGLSQEALQQVLAAGVQAGTNIANELITGGATTIEQTNELVRTSQKAADDVGLEAAQSFFGAGVKTAQDTYEGFKANFGKGGPARKALMGVMDNLARAAARDVRIDVAVTRSINEVVTRVVQTINAPYAGERAMGGPVKAGSAYLIGERGPELFVPDISGTVVSNSDMRSSGGVAVGSGVTLNVYAGMGTDGAEVGRQIVEALKQYERRNGAVPIRTA